MTGKTKRQHSRLTEIVSPLIAIVVVFWCASNIAKAQESTAKIEPSPSQSPSPKPEPSPVVVTGGVYKRDSVKDETNEQTRYGQPQAGMNDIVIIRVRNFQKLLNDAECKTADKPNCRKQKIVLYMDGRAMKGLVPESGAPIIENPVIDQKVSEAAREARLKPQTDALKVQYKDDPKKLAEETDKLLAANPLPTALSDEGTLRFHIQRTTDSDEEWADLLGSPPIFSQTKEKGSLFIRPVQVSVGLENEHAISSESDDKFSFIRVHKWWFWFVTIGLLALLIVVVVLARKTNLLRDDVQPIGENAKGVQTDERPYSLGRVQMAFWFFLIVTAFLYLFLVTWQTNTVTEQALALMGISAATALGALAVSSNKSEMSEDSLQDSAARYPVLRAERQTLQAKTNELSQKVQSSSAATTETEELDESRAMLRRVKKEIRDVSSVSQGFINDLLTDIHGYSFHRFQIFVWTIVLGFIFLHGVYHRLAMPVFSATLLALLGISGATYIGFKIPERQQPDPQPPTGGGGAASGNADSNASTNANASTAANANTNANPNPNANANASTDANANANANPNPKANANASTEADLNANLGEASDHQDSDDV